MTPQERAERARPGAYKQEMAKYENDPRTKGYTFLFAQPRSGSTLLMRLMKLACHTNVVGDQDLNVYKAINALCINSFDGVYGDLQSMENNNIFA